MLIKRRNFLRNSSVAAAGTLLIPQFLQAMYQRQMSKASGKVLVVIQLSGGNDGLNTVIPVRNDIYYRVRPRLAIQAGKALGLKDEVALNPALSAFKGFYNDGHLAILNNVGYPNPDRSHFRSMDIWHTASDSNQYIDTGWLGRYLDAACSGCAHPTQILEMDDVLSLALKGNEHSGLACKDPARLFATSSAPQFRKMSTVHVDGEEPVADYLYKTLGETIQSAEMVFKASKQNSPKGTYPNSELGKSLRTISSLISSDLETSVYYVSLGSFDTHVNQEAQQTRLLTELNDAVAAFVDDLKKQNRFNDTLIMTFSEFGRRVAQNASGGTDHGTANNMFFIGGSLKQQGVLNAMPNLGDLDKGDLKFSTDFRQVYATVLNNWLKMPSEKILGSQFSPLHFV